MILRAIATLMMHLLTLYLVVICKTTKKDLSRKAAGRTPKSATPPVITKEQPKDGEEKKEKADNNKQQPKDGEEKKEKAEKSKSQKDEDKTALEAPKKDEKQKEDDQKQRDKSNKKKQGEEKKEEMGDKNENKEAVKKEDKSNPEEGVEKNETKQGEEKEKNDKRKDMAPVELKDKKEDEDKPDEVKTAKVEVNQEEKKSEKAEDNKQAEAKEEETQAADPSESQGTPSLNMTGANLTISPTEIRWEFEQGQQNIRIKNDTKYRFAFKFRCTDNALYSVSPVMAFVDAGKFVNVAVIRAKGPFKKDRFIVCSKQVSADEKDAYAVFRTGTPHMDTISMDQLVRA